MPTEDSPSPQSATPIRARHFRAPQGDGEALIEPPLNQVYSLLSRKKGRLKPSRDESWIFSKSIDYYRVEASYELFSKALRYTKEYRDLCCEFSTGGLGCTNIVAGHQPTLFHPGVWLKNFVLDRTKIAGINLVIDNDIAGDASIRIPAGSLAQPQFESLGLDEPFENVPFEERPTVSPPAVSSFADRLNSHFHTADWYPEHPSAALLASQLASYLEVPRGGKSGLPLGETFARARHRLEQDFGLNTLELPLSVVAQSNTFRTFALYLLQHAHRFHEIYNRSLAEYRLVNKIRSTSHPVPALTYENEPIPQWQVDGEWLEAPFWIWTKDNPRRRRLFIRRDAMSGNLETIAFSDRRETITSLMGPKDDPGPWLHLWKGMEDDMGIKIRPRALITTMYARLFLSDLFIHGIGGAKYDELTDAIIRRFFGIEPPEYLTVTGTVRLPIPRPTTTAADVRNVKQLIREIRFHPERFVNDASAAIRESAAQFAEQKRGLLREHQFHFKKATPEQFRALDDLNRQLSILLTDVEIRLRDELKTREREAHDNKLLGSREFSFVLHPADELPEQLKRMAT